MKRSTLIVGMVIGGHAVAALLLFQGCQTVHDGEVGRPLPPSEPVTTLPPPSAPVPLPPTPPATQPFGEPTTSYIVRAGDSISSIASRYALNPRDIVALNRLENPDVIRVGQKLILPGKIDLGAEAPRVERPARPPATADGQQVHEVQPGETISHIALRYKVTQDALKRANNLTDVNRVRVGQKLVIPGASRGTVAPDATGRPELAPRPDRPVPPSLPDMPDGTIDPLPPDPVEPPPVVDRQTGTATDSGYRTVTVKPNEDLITLAVRWNVTPSLLRQINGLADNNLHPGQTLRIPISD